MSHSNQPQDTTAPNSGAHHGFVFDPGPRPSLAVTGRTERFPVNRIYCVGRNYADHAIEMGHDPKREEPFFFQKSPDCLVTAGGAFPYPDRSQDVHHELELVVALGDGGKNIPLEGALGSVFGYAVGLDMTRRDLQGAAKKAGRPWDVGKAFDHSAPCSDILPASSIGHPDKGRIHLTVNGRTRQDGDLSQMIWKVPEIINYLSGLFTLRPGDLIFSGTPAGVGPVQQGDHLEGSIEQIGKLTVEVT